MTVQERASRAEGIVGDRARGYTWTHISERHGLSERQCRRLVADYHSDAPSIAARDPIEIVSELLDRYEGVIGELTEIAATTTHDATKVGAIKQKMVAMEAEFSLLQAVGVMPQLRAVGYEMDARWLARTVLETFERHAIPSEVTDEIVALIRGGARSGSNGHAPALG